MAPDEKSKRRGGKRQQRGGDYDSDDENERRKQTKLTKIDKLVLKYMRAKLVHKEGKLEGNIVNIFHGADAIVALQKSPWYFGPSVSSGAAATANSNATNNSANSTSTAAQRTNQKRQNQTKSTPFFGSRAQIVAFVNQLLQKEAFHRAIKLKKPPPHPPHSTASSALPDNHASQSQSSNSAAGSAANVNGDATTEVRRRKNNAAECEASGKSSSSAAVAAAATATSASSGSGEEKRRKKPSSPGSSGGGVARMKLTMHPLQMFVDPIAPGSLLSSSASSSSFSSNSAAVSSSSSASQKHTHTYADELLKEGDVYVWLWEPVNWLGLLQGGALLLLIVGLCLFPLWPAQLRLASYWLSVAAIGLVSVILGAVVLRGVVFCCVFVCSGAQWRLWLLPNLTADCGFCDSFRPAYSFKRSTNNKNSKNSQSENAKKQQQHAAEKHSATENGEGDARTKESDETADHEAEKTKNQVEDANQSTISVAA